MRRIKVFLASSSELREDRREFEIFINRENKRLTKQDIFLDLEIWEDFLDALAPQGLQNEYNKVIVGSDIFVMLYFTKVGKYTAQEFEAAIGAFKEEGRPTIYTFFKTAAINTGTINAEEMQSLFDFQAKLKALAHYPTLYKSTEDLLLQFKRQLEKWMDQRAEPENNTKSKPPAFHPPHALSDVYGKIEQIAIAIPGNKSRWTKDFFKERYGNILMAIGDRVQFIFIAQSADQTRQDVLQEFQKALLELNFEPSNHILHFDQIPYENLSEDLQRGNSEWVANSFFVGRSHTGEPFLFAPPIWGTSRNLSLADQVARAAGLMVKSLKYNMMAGDFLFGDDFALVGIRTIEEIRYSFFAHESSNEAQNKIEKELKTAFGIRYLIVIGSIEMLRSDNRALQSLFIISRLINLGGKSNAGDELVFLADIDTQHNLLEKSESAIEELKELQNYFDKIREQLENSYHRHPGPRFFVERVPMIFDSKKETIYSYNEVLIESFNGTKRVYLPSYAKLGLQEVQKQIMYKYQQHGFNRVTFVDNAYEHYSRMSGSMGGLLKVLKRS